jgi:hypothetical protein
MQILLLQWFVTRLESFRPAVSFPGRDWAAGS